MRDTVTVDGVTLKGGDVVIWRDLQQFPRVIHDDGRSYTDECGNACLNGLSDDGIYQRIGTLEEIVTFYRKEKGL